MLSSSHVPWLAVVVAVVVVTFLGWRFLQARMLAARSRRLAEQNPPRPGSEHLLSCGTVVNCLPAMTLAAPVRPGEVRALLSRFWDVHDHDQAVAALAWLRDAGHRTEFAPFVEPLLTGDPRTSSVLQEYQYDPATARRNIELVRRILVGRAVTEQEFGAVRSIAAWDIERIATVARLARIADYLSEDEAYQWLYVVDQTARQRFTSWKDYAVSFVLGRSVCYPHDSYGLARMAHTLRRRLNDPEDPWARFPLKVA